MTQFGYDALGRLTSVTDADLNVTRYTYDEAGNKLTQTDALNRTTRWSYDAVGRVLTRQLPLGQTEAFTYDATGNVLKHTDFNGQVSTNTYNPLNDQLVQTTYSDGASESFTYTADSQIATATNGEGTTTYSYDAMGRLATETQPNGGTLAYSYDSTGNRTSVTATQNGVSTTTSYSYDALNRLASVTDTNGTTTYSYDAVGNQSAVVYPNAFSQRYQYNAVNRLTTLEHVNNGTVTERYSYTLDPTGKRTQLDELNGRSTVWGYDNLNRLTSESISRNGNAQHTESYSYDLVGNRTSATVNGSTTAYGYDFNDRLLTAGSVAYAYDNNGNTLSETDSSSGTVKTYAYNSKNQLTGAVTADATLGFSYDISGIRTAKTVNGVTTRYLTDSNRDYAQVLLEETAGASTAYTYGNDLVSLKAANDAKYYLYDGLGSTRALADSAGSVTDQYEYSAYGTTLLEVGETANAYRYTGEQFDSELGDYYLRARYYRLGDGRFLTMDTYQGRMQEPVTLHKYLYANGAPSMWVDPSGNVTLGELTSAMRVASDLASTSMRIYQYSSKASSFLDFFLGYQELSRLSSSGAISAYMKEGIQGSLDNHSRVDIDDAVDSLSRNSATLMMLSFQEWSTYLTTHSKSIDRFVIYLPQWKLPISKEITIRKKGKFKINLALDAKGRHRLTGLGIGLIGRAQPEQIWRMDYHEKHDQKNEGKDAYYFFDRQFHYHINRIPTK